MWLFVCFFFFNFLSLLLKYNGINPISFYYNILIMHAKVSSVNIFLSLTNKSVVVHLILSNSVLNNVDLLFTINIVLLPWGLRFYPQLNSTGLLHNLVSTYFFHIWVPHKEFFISSSISLLALRATFACGGGSKCPQLHFRQCKLSKFEGIFFLFDDSPRSGAWMVPFFRWF